MDPNRLTAIPIFSELSPEEAHRLAAFATETSAAEGQILIKEGDYSVELIAIEEGTADVIQGGKKIASLGAGRPDRRDGAARAPAAQRRRDRHLADAADQADPLGDPAHVRGHGRSDQGDDRGAAQAGVADPAHSSDERPVRSAVLARIGSAANLIRCAAPNSRIAAPGSGEPESVGASLVVIREKRSSPERQPVS